MNLKHEVKSFILIKNIDLENLIYQEYGINHSILIPFFKEYEVTKRILTAHEKERMDLFLAKEKIINYIHEILLVDLCNKGIVDEGIYIIKL